MELKVEGMNCMHCKARVTNALKALGLKKIEVDLDSKTVSFKESKKVDLATVKKALDEAGYQVV